MLKRIVAIGPESTGKSSLSKQLAEHYNTLWCPEYAREYLTVHGMNYTYDDLLTIAKGQLDLEEKYTQLATGPATRREQLANGKDADSNSALITHHSMLFIDTDMYVMKVWCEFVFGKSHQYILDQIEKRKYDLYLLCNIDLPWVHDELREYPHEGPRQELYEIYKNIMQNQSTPWAEINGNYEQRLQKAIDAVDNLLKK
jgi:NadR type nicotinamide-nucleotide adenylyltransferase